MNRLSSFLFIATLLLTQNSCFREPKLKSGVSGENPKRVEILEKRNSATGRKFTSLTLGGEVYSEAVVKSVDDSGIQIEHAKGTATLKWPDLEQIVKEKWGYDHVAYQGYLKEEQELVQIQQRNFAKAEEEKRKKELRGQIQRINLAIEKENLDLERHNAELKELEDKYDEEDRNKRSRRNRSTVLYPDDGDTISDRRMGGPVSTSKADREKKLNRIRENIIELKEKIQLFKLKKSEVESELENL